ncbi:MAG: flavodoxin, partial [Candidatus Hodarchaeota archaeon]
ELLNNIADMGTYDLIFLGYPNWWGTMPMAVYTFLESSDFSGKMIVPFCTHEGSGLGRSVKDIKKCCPRAEIKNASPFRGSSVKNASDDVEKWLKTC